MKEIIEQHGSAAIAMATGLILIGVCVGLFHDGGVIHTMVAAYLSSICG